MKIACIDFQNFRKLKNCRVGFSEKKIVLVGANNSGKTSAMDALILFLKKSRRKNLSTTDFTLSNWQSINEIAQNWIENENSETINLNPDAWYPFVPSIDVWLSVEDNEVHYVSHIIPTLDWKGGNLGVRLIFEPRNVEDLYKSYKLAYETAKTTSNSRGKNKPIKLWPQSMREFLNKELHKYFTVNAYILDPSKNIDEIPQNLPENSEPIDGEPFEGLFKIDIINAQRGFSDPNSGEAGTNNDRRLSTQLRGYFEKHLNPTELPEISDLEALEAIEEARTAFDSRLKESFKSSIAELEGLNYPGFSDPKIQISSKVEPLEGLNHDSAIQFNVLRDDSKPEDLSWFFAVRCG